MQNRNKQSSIIRGGQTAIATSRLGSRIVQRVYTPAAALPIEPDLAAELGVSRNSLREAVKTLVGKGLLSVSPRRGTFVTASSEWNLLDKDILNWYMESPTESLEILGDIAELRHIIEPAAAKIAAKNATREDVAAITAAYHDMEANADNPRRFVDADIEFHEAILRATHNSVLCSFRRAFEMLLRPNFERFQVEKSSEYKKNIVRHRDLALAIAAGNANKAFEMAAELVSFAEEKTTQLRATLSSSTRNR